MLKSLWRALGPNLVEANADRVAGTLEAVFESIDQDCCNYDSNSLRTSTDLKAVAQIAKDLLDQHVFEKTTRREGHPYFPKLERSLPHDLDYSDLHK